MWGKDEAKKTKKNACEYMKSHGEWRKGLDKNMLYTTTWFATTCKYVEFFCNLYLNSIYIFGFIYN
jgi:hypothetical protein